MEIHGFSKNERFELTAKDTPSLSEDTLKSNFINKIVKSKGSWLAYKCNLLDGNIAEYYDDIGYIIFHKDVEDLDKLNLELLSTEEQLHTKFSSNMSGMIQRTISVISTVAARYMILEKTFIKVDSLFELDKKLKNKLFRLIMHAELSQHAMRQNDIFVQEILSTLFHYVNLKRKFPIGEDEIESYTMASLEYLSGLLVGHSSFDEILNVYFNIRNSLDRIKNYNKKFQVLYDLNRFCGLTMLKFPADIFNSLSWQAMLRDIENPCSMNNSKYRLTMYSREFSEWAPNKNLTPRDIWHDLLYLENPNYLQDTQSYMNTFFDNVPPKFLFIPGVSNVRYSDSDFDYHYPDYELNFEDREKNPLQFKYLMSILSCKLHICKKFSRYALKDLKRKNKTNIIDYLFNYIDKNIIYHLFELPYFLIHYKNEIGKYYLSYQMEGVQAKESVNFKEFSVFFYYWNIYHYYWYHQKQILLYSDFSILKRNYDPDMKFCPLYNTSICDYTKNDCNNCNYHFPI